MNEQWMNKRRGESTSKDSKGHSATAQGGGPRPKALPFRVNAPGHRTVEQNFGSCHRAREKKTMIEKDRVLTLIISHCVLMGRDFELEEV